MKWHFACVALVALVLTGPQAGALPAPATSTGPAPTTSTVPAPTTSTVPARATSPAAAASSAAEEAPDSYTPVSPDDKKTESAQLVARFLTHFHYAAQPLDDDMSEAIFNEYLKTLDGSRMYLSQKDIDDFKSLRDNLDNAIWERDLDGPFKLFNRYARRRIQRYQYALKQLDSGFKFDGDAKLELDREGVDWPADGDTLDALWHKRVKNDWLRLKLAGKDADDIRDVLRKRYNGYIDRVRQLDAQDAFQTFMDAYARTTDPHTDYLGPRRAENFAISMRLSLEGIGAVLQADREYTQIRKLVPGGPAAKSGKLDVGDHIVGVGQGKHGDIRDVLGWRLSDVVDKIRGKKGSRVRLEIIPAKAGLDGKHKIITLTRDKVDIKAKAAKKQIIDVGEGDQTRRIGVIDLPSFYEDFGAHGHHDTDYTSASRDVEKLLKQLKAKDVDGVIVDLRGNGGGSLQEAIRMTGLFINQGPVVQVRGSDGSVKVDNDTDSGMVWSGPLAVMVNRSSASASEIFAAAIKDYGRGILIGNQTFGKGTVQNLVDLDRFGSDPGDKPTYGKLKMTIAKFFRINGGSTQKHGVKPDIEFPGTVHTDDIGESTYDNALSWTEIGAADYQPVADLSSLVPKLEKKHKQRVADSPAWQLLLDELSAYRKNRERTAVSLNYDKRKARREKFESRQKSFEKRHDKIDDDNSDSLTVQLDDGLQPSEHSLQEQLQSEENAKESDDVELHEAAHILSDEADMISKHPHLGTTVLPYGGKYTSGFDADKASGSKASEPSHADADTDE